MEGIPGVVGVSAESRMVPQSGFPPGGVAAETTGVKAAGRRGHAAFPTQSAD